MSKNNSRTLVSSEFTEDGLIEFKLWDTGSFLARWHDAGLTKSGVDKAIVRINALKEKEIELLPKLKELIVTMADRSDALIIDYNSALNYELLKYAVEDRTHSPAFRWALLMAGVAEVRVATVEELVKRAEAAEERLAKATATNGYRYYLRPDLGYFSQNNRKKAVTIEELDVRNEEIAKSIETPVLRLALERIDSGVVTASVETLRNQALTFNGYTGTLYGAGMILTREELNSLSDYLKANGVHDEFTLKPALLIGYTYFKLGEARARELIQFFVKSQRDPTEEERLYYWRRAPISFDTMRSEAGELSYLTVLRVLMELQDDLDTPLEWAMMLGV